MGRDHQHARRGVEPGGDAGVSGCRPEDAVRWQETGRSECLGDEDLAPSTLPGARQGGARIAEALCGENDWPEPGAGNAHGRPILKAQRSEEEGWRVESLRGPLHAGRSGAAGESGRSPRDTFRPGHKEDPGARVDALQENGIRGWRRFRWPTFTTCASGGITGNAG